jgi:hypothetical protein
MDETSMSSLGPTILPGPGPTLPKPISRRTPVKTRGVKKLLTREVPNDPQLDAQPLYMGPALPAPSSCVLGPRIRSDARWLKL